MLADIDARRSLFGKHLEYNHPKLGAMGRLPCSPKGGRPSTRGGYFPDRSRDRFRHVWRAPTASLHLVERFTPVAAGRIDYEATITDPTRLTRRWTVRFPLSAAASALTAGA